MSARAAMGPRRGCGRAMRAGALVLGLAFASAALGGGPRPAWAADVTVRSAVSATHVPLGESVDWVISVEGVNGADQPKIPPLDFAQVEFGGTSQEMSFVNGQLSARVVWQYRLTPTREGRFAIPAITVHAHGRVYTTDPIAFLVTPAQPGAVPSFGAGGGGTAPRLKLVATAEPRTVVVNQPVVYTIRLYQGTRLLGDPDFRGPNTPRFFVENAGIGRTYYEGTGPDRWLVGERKTVLYPTATGRLTIGPASMTCLVADPNDPDGLQVNLASDPIPIDVRPLPPAPAGYEGAVADASLSGVVDRATIRADEAIVVTFRLSGDGNLHLAPPPAFKDLEDFDLFEHHEEDSLAVEDGRTDGTKIVRYTLLPRRPGVLRLPPVRYVTYVPGQGYRTLNWAGATIEVTPGLARDLRGAGGRARFALAPTTDPGGSAWNGARLFFAAAFALVALAAWLFALARRRAAQGDGQAAERVARLRAAQAALEDARRRDDARAFWRHAEEALLEAEGGEALRARVARARYAPGGGDARDVASLAPDLAAFLDAAARAGSTGARPLGWPVRVAVSLLALLALSAAGLGAYRVAAAPADADVAPRLAHAARLLGAGQVPAGDAELRALWNGGARRPGVALDLAVAAYYEKRLGEAALWTERGRRLDPRHALAGDLAQALAQQDAWEGLPVGLRAQTTAGELVFAGLVLVALALLAFAARGKGARLAGLAALVLAVAALGMAAREAAVGQAPGRAVVTLETPLADSPGGASNVTLEAGRAVWLREASGGWQKVRVSAQVEGWVPARSVAAL